MAVDAEQEEEPFELPEFVRATIESVARFMRIGGAGNWTLELQFQDGRLRRFWRHEGPPGAKDPRTVPRAKPAEP